MMKAGVPGGIRQGISTASRVAIVCEGCQFCIFSWKEVLSKGSLGGLIT